MPDVPKEVSADAVRKSIENAAEFITRHQKKEGFWPDRPHYDGGLTPLCLLSLMHAGHGLENPTVKKGMDYLRTVPPTNTYATSLQTMVFCYLDPKKNRDLIVRNARWLESKQVKNGTDAGMWSVPSRSSNDHIDNSMTHFAILGLYEAQRAGVPVSDLVWRQALGYWQRSQNQDGSWGWGPGDAGTGSMTCAGIAAIIIASGQLNTPDAAIEQGQLRCCGNQTSNPALDRALQWLERHFSVRRNPASMFWRSYYLYSLERAGRLTNRRFIGDHDWYREGAAALVAEQLNNGSWSADLDYEHAEDPLVSTCFNLMFLAKARRPVVMAHIQHAPNDDWNPHRSALFNLVTHVETLWKRELTYQVVSIGSASVEDLLQAPVLFINGKDAPLFNTAEKEKLRMYVDRGGFIFAEGCCGGQFDAGFRKLMKEVFPEPDAALRELPPSHPAWLAETPVVPGKGRELFGVDVGCRTAVIYAPQDLTCYWELASTGRDLKLPPGTEKQMQEAQAIGANVLAYATNREVKFKDPSFLAHSEREVTLPERGKLQIAKVQHSGGCDAAPKAVHNLLRIAQDKYGVPASVDTQAILLTSPKLFQYHLLVFSGRTRFRLSDNERKQVRTYLERGGTILADSINSSREFASSFRNEMKLIFPDLVLKPISSKDSIYSREFGGETIKKVQLRKSSNAGVDGKPGTTLQQIEPVLEGLTVGDRYAVIFSPYDISCALDSSSQIGFEGYDHVDAARLGINVLLYSLHK
ncbi:MAG: DUF4159 domain-containing protein [Planctomycetota bacterium]|nr:DUF4159 domain-containing protein [Planctomycetota bacterium]